MSEEGWNPPQNPLGAYVDSFRRQRDRAEVERDFAEGLIVELRKVLFAIATLTTDKELDDAKDLAAGGYDASFRREDP